LKDNRRRFITVKELKQYRTCNGCKAEAGHMCQFNFKKEGISETGAWAGLTLNYKPLEPCYKPKTNDELMSCIDYKLYLERTNKA
jgi:hypothetical protein